MTSEIIIDALARRVMAEGMEVANVPEPLQEAVQEAIDKQEAIDAEQETLRIKREEEQEAIKSEEAKTLEEELVEDEEVLEE